MLKYLLASIVLIGYNAVMLQAQQVSCTVVNGRVLNTQYEPIAAATIEVDEACLKTQLIASALGTFSFKICQCDSVLIKVSAVGFMPLQRWVFLSGKGSAVTLGAFVITEDAGMLDTVVVVAAPIQVRGDTINYSSGAFMPVKPNASVADLLANLPGVKVNKEGEVTINGKMINTIRIDGKEYLPSERGVLIQQLAASLFRQVQVVDPSSASFKRPRQPSINLLTQSGLPPSWFGRLQAEIGNSAHFADAGVYKLHSGTYLAAGVHTNNISDPKGVKHKPLQLDILVRDIKLENDEDIILQQEADEQSPSESSIVDLDVSNGIYEPSSVHISAGRLWNDSNQLDFSARFGRVDFRELVTNMRRNITTAPSEMLSEKSIFSTQRQNSMYDISLNYLITKELAKWSMGMHIQNGKLNGQHLQAFEAMADQIIYLSNEQTDSLQRHQRQALLWFQAQIKPSVIKRSFLEIDLRWLCSEEDQQRQLKMTVGELDLNAPTANLIYRNLERVFDAPVSESKFRGNIIWHIPKSVKGKIQWQMGSSQSINWNNQRRLSSYSSILLPTSLQYNYSLLFQRYDFFVNATNHFGKHWQLATKMSSGAIIFNAHSSNQFSPGWRNSYKTKPFILPNIDLSYAPSVLRRISLSLGSQINGVQPASWWLPITDSLVPGVWSLGNANLRPFPYFYGALQGLLVNKKGWIGMISLRANVGSNWALQQATLLPTGNGLVALSYFPAIFNNYKRFISTAAFTVPLGNRRHELSIESISFNEKATSSAKDLLKNRTFVSNLSWRYRQKQQYEFETKIGYHALRSAFSSQSSDLQLIKLRARALVLIKRRIQLEWSANSLHPLNRKIDSDALIMNASISYVARRGGWELLARFNNILDTSLTPDQALANNVQESSINLQQARVITAGVVWMFGQSTTNKNSRP